MFCLNNVKYKDAKVVAYFEKKSNTPGSIIADTFSFLCKFTTVKQFFDWQNCVYVLRPFCSMERQLFACKLTVEIFFDYQILQPTSSRQEFCCNFAIKYRIENHAKWPLCVPTAHVEFDFDLSKLLIVCTKFCMMPAIKCTHVVVDD